MPSLMASRAPFFAQISRAVMERNGKGVHQQARHREEDDGERENLLERLGRILAETSTACYGWALLANHGHLLLRKGELRFKGDERILGVPVSPAGHRERSNSPEAGVADLRRIG